MLTSLEEFRAVWYDPSLIEILEREREEIWYRDLKNGWHSELVTASPKGMEGVVIPDAARDFLLTVGLPRSIPAFAMRFSGLSTEVHLISDLEPDKIQNGIEYPPLRYTQFYKIGDDGNDKGYYGHTMDICIQKYHGKVYILTYGAGAFSKIEPLAGAWHNVSLQTPEITSNTYLGPTFVNSSLVQMANSIQVFRDVFVRYGIDAGMHLKKDRTLAQMLKRRLRKIDEVAVVHPEGFWGGILEQVAEGSF